MRLAALLCILLVATAGPTAAHRASQQARVYFVQPRDGTLTANPVRFEFGADEIAIAPVGVDRHRTGHFHLLIDVDDPLDLDTPIPADTRHRHFSDGETAVELHLEPGRHTLQLVLGDEEHLPWAEWLFSEPITIEVTD